MDDQRSRLSGAWVEPVTEAVTGQGDSGGKPAVDMKPFSLSQILSVVLREKNQWNLKISISLVAGVEAGELGHRSPTGHIRERISEV